MELSKENTDKVFELVEVSKKTGKLKKGINEVTKSVEKGVAKLVAYGGDVNPAEVIMHLEPLCKEKQVICVKVPSKEELGRAAGLAVGTAAIAVIDEGQGKKLLTDIKELSKE